MKITHLSYQQTIKFQRRFIRMSKIVVFGGSGFMGSHVADALSNESHEVIIFDSEPSEYIKENQSQFLGSLEDLDAVKNVISGSDVVYNFAALSDLNEAMDRPIEVTKSNILGNCNILEGCRLNSVKRFIYASSVYVNSREGGFYGVSKKSAELFVEEYLRAFGLEFTILRYGSLYGPRSNNKNGLRKIISDAIQNNSLTYNGNKDAIREYIHVRDAARASVKAMEKKYKNKKLILTGHQPIKVMDLLKMLSEMMNFPKKSINFINEEYKGHYIQTPYHHDPDLAQKYIPDTFIDLGEGLLELIQECSKQK